MAGAHHRDPLYIARAANVRAAANANPKTKCWRCQRTLAEHEPHHDGTPPRWQAGHTIDGDNAAPLMPEASTCNTSAGATAGNLARTNGLEAAKVSAAQRWRG